MPGVTSIGKAKLDFLCSYASTLVVSLIRYSKETKKYIDFGTGFVIYDDNIKTVILTCSEVFNEDEEEIVVCFSDGQTKQASVFVSDVSSIYTTLVVDSTGSSDAITFSSSVARGEIVFTVTRALEEIKRPGIFTGSIIHPSCLSVNTHTDKPVDKHSVLFALSCPVAGPCVELQRCASETIGRLIGAPVFNLKCEVVGVIERSSQNKHDLKFARLSDSVNKELQILFGSADWMGTLELQLMNKSSK